MDDLEEHHTESVCRVVGTLAIFEDDRVKGRTCAREFVAEFSARFPSPVPYCIGAPDLGDGRHTSTEIAARMGMLQKELSVRRDGLIEEGLIYNPVAANLDFTVPQFGAYPWRIHPFDPNQRPEARPPAWRRHVASKTRLRSI